MPATADQLAVVRSWIGNKETDDVFNERFDRLGSLDAAITESLRAQLTQARINPESVTLDDGTSARFAIAELAKTLDAFLAQGGTDGLPDGPGKNVTQMTRKVYR